MSWNRLLRHLFLFCWPFALEAGSIISGPMLGYRAHREVLLWLETRDAATVTLEYWPQDQSSADGQSITHPQVKAHPAGGQIHHFRPGLLKMGTTYRYRILIDGQEQPLSAPATFSTHDLWPWRQPPPDFSFLVGSCAYINDPAYDRPGKGYGRTTRTFELMGESGADFMIWTGDNWYLREADFDSISGHWYRPQHDRALPEMQRLLGVMHHYATWDDHDYGSNDSNRSYEFKQVALEVFKAYWGNPGYAEPGQQGVYGKFFWGDAAFFLMDNHWYRDAATLDQDHHRAKSQWGPQQLDWLKQSLLAVQRLGHYQFLFIATGNQMLQSTHPAESHMRYRREREDLLNFIEEHHIAGVVFLTGDVHFSALYRRRLGSADQWVYEITSSPLSSQAWIDAAEINGEDTHLLPGTIVGDQNFVRIDIAGEGAARALLVRCIDQRGNTRFNYRLKGGEALSVPREP